MRTAAPLRKRSSPRRPPSRSSRLPPAPWSLPGPHVAHAPDGAALHAPSRQDVAAASPLPPITPGPSLFAPAAAAPASPRELRLAGLAGPAASSPHHSPCARASARAPPPTVLIRPPLHSLPNRPRRRASRTRAPRSGRTPPRHASPANGRPPTRTASSAAPRSASSRAPPCTAFPRTFRTRLDNRVGAHAHAAHHHVSLPSQSNTLLSRPNQHSPPRRPLAKTCTVDT